MKNEAVDMIKGIAVFAWMAGWAFTVSMFAGLGIEDTGAGLFLSVLAVPGWPIILGLVVGKAIRVLCGETACL